MELYSPLERKKLKGIFVKHAHLDKNTDAPEIPYANELLQS